MTKQEIHAALDERLREAKRMFDRAVARHEADPNAYNKEEALFWRQNYHSELDKVIDLRARHA